MSDYKPVSVARQSQLMDFMHGLSCRFGSGRHSRHNRVHNVVRSAECLTAWDKFIGRHPAGHAPFSWTARSAPGRRAGKKERRSDVVAKETGADAITRQLVFVAIRVHGSSSYLPAEDGSLHRQSSAAIVWRHNTRVVIRDVEPWAFLRWVNASVATCHGVDLVLFW